MFARTRAAKKVFSNFIFEIWTNELFENVVRKTDLLIIFGLLNSCQRRDLIEHNERTNAEARQAKIETALPHKREIEVINSRKHLEF